MGSQQGDQVLPALARILALDVGGSSVKAGVVQDGNMVTTTRHPIQSQADTESVLAQFREIISNYSDFQALAFAFPGPFNYQEGVCLIQGLDKYGQLYGVNLRTELGNGLPTVFLNDAEAAIQGEARFGNGQGYQRVLGITLGTGLGSAFLIDGVTISQGRGVPDGGWLYKQPVGAQIADEVFSIRGVTARAERWNVEAQEPKDIAEQALWEEFGEELGSFLDPYTQEFGADVLLVLGGLSGAFPLFGKALENQLKIPVLSGKLGAAAPLLGAAGALLRNSPDF